MVKQTAVKRTGSAINGQEQGITVGMDAGEETGDSPWEVVEPKQRKQQGGKPAEGTSTSKKGEKGGEKGTGTSTGGYERALTTRARALAEKAGGELESARVIRARQFGKAHWCTTVVQREIDLLRRWRSGNESGSTRGGTNGKGKGKSKGKGGSKAKGDPRPRAIQEPQAKGKGSIDSSSKGKGGGRKGQGDEKSTGGGKGGTATKGPFKDQ
jgi:hypothetical protein